MNSRKKTVKYVQDKNSAVAEKPRDAPYYLEPFYT